MIKGVKDTVDGFCIIMFCNQEIQEWKNHNKRQTSIFKDDNSSTGAQSYRKAGESRGLEKIKYITVNFTNKK